MSKPKLKSELKKTGSPTGTNKSKVVSAISSIPSMTSLEEALSGVVAVLPARVPTITTDKQLAVCREYYEVVKEAEKIIASKKSPILNPLKEATVQVNKLFKPYESAVSDLKIELADAIKTYINEQEAARLAAIAAIESDKRLKNPATIEQKMAEVGLRAAGTRKIKKLYITDLLLLPRHYLIPNEGLIRADLLAGETVPGAEMREELTL